MNGQQYKVITGELVKTIIAAGFYEKKAQGQQHGLDMTKLNAVSLFYLPCQPKDPSGAYFKVFKGNGREPLIVQEWIEKYIAEEEALLKNEDANTFIETPLEEVQPLSETHPFMPNEGSGVDQEEIERACWEWQRVSSGRREP